MELKELCKNIEGEYTSKGYYLQKDSTTLLIRERKKELDKKPPMYLLIKGDKVFVYVSSLFKVKDNEYVFDNREDNFRLRLESGSAVIEKQ